MEVVVGGWVAAAVGDQEDGGRCSGGHGVHCNRRAASPSYSRRTRGPLNLDVRSERSRRRADSMSTALAPTPEVVATVEPMHKRWTREEFYRLAEVGLIRG